MIRAAELDPLVRLVDDRPQDALRRRVAEYGALEGVDAVRFGFADGMTEG